jgi:hypothetical protein
MPDTIAEERETLPTLNRPVFIRVCTWACTDKQAQLMNCCHKVYTGSLPSAPWHSMDASIESI